MFVSEPNQVISDWICFCALHSFRLPLQSVIQNTWGASLPEVAKIGRWGRKGETFCLWKVGGGSVSAPWWGREEDFFLLLEIDKAVYWNVEHWKKRREGSMYSQEIISIRSAAMYSVIKCGLELLFFLLFS